ncbi:MAG TPA: hypothetical protein VIS54_10535 [Psychromonas sp.]
MGYETSFDRHDFLLGTPLWGLGLFMMLLKKHHWGNYPVVYKLGGMILGIYVAHLPIAILVHNFADMLALETYVRDIVLVLGTTIFTLLFVWSVSYTPLRKVLLR